MQGLVQQIKEIINETCSEVLEKIELEEKETLIAQKDEVISENEDEIAEAARAAVELEKDKEDIERRREELLASNAAAKKELELLASNLDDANQYMNHLLTSDVIASPDLSLKDAKLGAFDAPGLGFEIDPDAVAKAAQRHTQHTATAH